MRVLVTTGTRYYYRPSSVVGEYWRGEVAEVLERVVVVSVKVAYTHTHTDGPHRLHHPTPAYSHVRLSPSFLKSRRGPSQAALERSSQDLVASLGRRAQQGGCVDSRRCGAFDRNF